MASVAALLSLEEFRARFETQKPYYEFWFGEARQKSVPTWLHGYLQGLLVELLKRAGYIAASEVELRIAPDWQPVPDVVAADRIDGPYPTGPVPVVVEILSPKDPMPDMLQKCRLYARIGIQQILVLDPQNRDGWEWNNASRRLENVTVIHLPNGNKIDLNDVWEELARWSAPPNKP